MTKTCNIYPADNQKKMLNKYYTNKGIELLNNRLKNLIELYDCSNFYPLNINFRGMPKLIVKCKEELYGRILEIKDFLMIMKIELIKGVKE